MLVYVKIKQKVRTIYLLYWKLRSSTTLHPNIRNKAHTEYSVSVKPYSTGAMLKVSKFQFPEI